MKLVKVTAGAQNPSFGPIAPSSHLIASRSTGHAVHSVESLWYFPASHRSQLYRSDPLLVTEPCEHLVQVACPSLTVYQLRGHAVQLVGPLWYFPASQRSQMMRSAPRVTEPRGHLVHAAAPLLALYQPRGQDWH